MRNRQRNLRLSTWLMLALMIGSILSPIVSLATTVESTTSSEEQTEKTLQTLSSDLSIPSSSGTKPSENSTQSSTEETSTVEFTENSEVTISDNEEKPKTIVTQNTDTIDEHQLLIHEDPTNPQPSIKDQKIQQIEDKVYFSGKLFAGIEEGDKTESRTIVSKFALQSQTQNGDWQTEIDWLPEDITISEEEYNFVTEIALKDKETQYFRYILMYEVNIIHQDTQSVIEEKKEQGYFQISEKYSYLEKEEQNEEPQEEKIETSTNESSITNQQTREVMESMIQQDLKEKNKFVEETQVEASVLEKPTGTLPIAKAEKEKTGSLYMPRLQPRASETPPGGEQALAVKYHVGNIKGYFDKITFDFQWQPEPLAHYEVTGINNLFVSVRPYGSSSPFTTYTVLPNPGYPKNQWINMEILGLTPGQHYEFKVRVHYTRYDGQYATGTQDLSTIFDCKLAKPSSIGNPYIAGNDGTGTPIFWAGVWYENGASTADARMEISLDQNNILQSVNVSGFNSGGQEYVSGQFSNLSPNTTYYVRSIIYDSIFGWQTSSTWTEYKTKRVTIAGGPFVAGNDGHADPVFWAGAWYENGATATDARLEVSLDQNSILQSINVSGFNSGGQEYVSGQFSGLEPNKTYYVRNIIHDPVWGWQTSSTWTEYKTKRATTPGKPFIAGNDGTATPTFWAGIWYENGTTDSDARLEISLDESSILQTVIVTGFNSGGQNYISGQFSSLLPDKTYYVRSSVYDTVWGWQYSGWTEYKTKVSKIAQPFIAGNSGDIVPVFWCGVWYENGATVSDSKFEISMDKTTILQSLSTTGFNSGGTEYLSGQFTGLNRDTEYYVRSLINDPKWGWQISEWVPYNTDYLVNEEFYDLSGIHIKNNSVRVKKGQIYTPNPSNSFTHASQAYIYKGWLKESEWDGNSATPMPSLNTGPVDPLTTHNEKVYLIYDLDSNSLRLDEYPNKFDFGNQHKPESYNQIFDLDASKYASTEPTDGFKLRVRDDRASHPGWRLTSTFSQLVGVNNTSDQLVGAKISFGVELKEIQNPGTPSETAITPTPAIAPSFGAPVSGSTATLTADGSSLIFLRAPNTKGEGVWDVLIDFDSVKLFVPGGQGSTGEEYQGTIQWDLEDAP